MKKEEKEMKKTDMREAKEMATYTKAQVINSKAYKEKKDILNVLIKDGEKVSLDEVNKRVDEFMKGGVR